MNNYFETFAFFTVFKNVNESTRLVRIRLMWCSRYKNVIKPNYHGKHNSCSSQPLFDAFTFDLFCGSENASSSVSFAHNIGGFFFFELLTQIISEKRSENKNKNLKCKKKKKILKPNTELKLR